MITPASKKWVGDDHDFRRTIIRYRRVRGGKTEKFEVRYVGCRNRGKTWPKGRAINERRIREGKINAANMGTDGS